MSYTFLAAAGEESWAECFSDIPAYALSRLNLTVEKSSSSGSETESYQSSRYGMTCEPSTENHGEDSLMSSAADSLAKTYPTQTQTLQELTERSQAYGRKCSESLARLDPLTSSWKTAQCLLFEAERESLRIWPEWAMWDQVACWALPMPSGIWELRAQITNAAECGSVERIPTPTVCGNYNRVGASETSGDGFATYLKRYPTPQARDWKGKPGAPAMERGGFQSSLPAAVGGPPNPEFAEWLMGWPIGWTDLNPLEMDKFQAWLHSHGIHSQTSSDQ